jgi:hypothetical protein
MLRLLHASSERLPYSGFERSLETSSVKGLEVLSYALSLDYFVAALRGARS